MLYKVITVSSQKLRVRKEPSINSDVVGHLYKDNVYDCEPVNDEWARATSADTGVIGYVSRAYLQLCDQINDDVTITFTRAELKSMVDYINSLLGE